MPDLLGHALIAYVAASLVSWRFEWLSRPYVTAAMAGAFIPDLMKARLLADTGTIETVLGVPFAWEGLRTLGPVVLFVLVGTMAVVPDRDVRWRATLALALGAATHLVADALLRTATGLATPVFWPLSRYRPPTPGLFLSTEPWPTMLAAGAALAAWAVSRYRGSSGEPAVNRRPE